MIKLAMGLFCIFFIALSGMVITQTTRRVIRNHALVQSGIKANGNVVDYKQTTGKHGTIWPVVTFVTAEGTSITFESLYHPNISGYSMGQQVPVVYDPKDPHIAEINQPDRLWGGIAFPYFISTLFSGVGIVGVILLIKSGRKTDEPVSSASAILYSSRRTPEP